MVWDCTHTRCAEPTSSTRCRMARNMENTTGPAASSVTATSSCFASDTESASELAIVWASNRQRRGSPATSDAGCAQNLYEFLCGVDSIPFHSIPYKQHGHNRQVREME